MIHLVKIYHLSYYIECPINGKEWIYGSGIIISEDGLILTNNHLVEGAGDYYCEIGFTDKLSEAPILNYYATIATAFDKDGKEIFLSSQDLDIAILRIDESKDGSLLPNSFSSVSIIGDSDKLNIGDKVLLVGYPGFGENTLTVTDGIISGRLGADLIKVSAKIDQGNSGGGLFTEQGELIGLPTMVYSGSFEGMGYAIGIDSVKFWLEGLNLDFD